MAEKIGKVTLDYSKYPGEDYYCDGAEEDQLLEIVKNYSTDMFPRIIEEEKNWPILYHLSPLRENIVDWIPMKNTDKVLEVGSGCGAITGALSGKAGSVTCVDLSKKRSLINAYRHSECDNITIHVGNFKDIEPELERDFDYICLIGVFEYGLAYIGGKSPYEDFLCILKKHLKPGGRIIIAIENKYGLKYFAGCMEDHLGSYFSGIENYVGDGPARTFSRPGLERIFRKCGIQSWHFYYPYPDYKFMTTLFSDEYLPGKGELANNFRNFDRDRMLLFDEKKAFDGIVTDGLFSVFANSYLVVLGDNFPVKYVKYSNDRDPAYQIRTQIERERVGSIPRVYKIPLSKEAQDHVRGMALAYENLEKRYRGGKLAINRCNLEEAFGTVRAGFEFVNGVALSELFDACLEKEDMEGFKRLFAEYVDRIGYHSDFPVSDFDPVFSNILVNDDVWTLIDYEWTFGKAIETRELVFRAVYCYLLEDEKRNKLNLESILSDLNITQQEAEEYRSQEMSFQKLVTGRKRSMAEMRDLIGHRIMAPQKWIEKYEDSGLVNRVQIYEDTGKGFSEEESYFVQEAYQGENLIELKLTVRGNVKRVRIDPAMDSCMVKLTETVFNGQNVSLSGRKILAANGRIAKSADKSEQPSIVFPIKDPNIEISVEQLGPAGENILYMKMEIVRLPLAMAQDMAGAVKKLI